MTQKQLSLTQFKLERPPATQANKTSKSVRTQASTPKIVKGIKVKSGERK